MPEVTVSRPDDAGGVYRRLKVYVDGHEFAALRPNKSAVLTLPPGHHVLHGQMDSARSEKLELNLADGDSPAVEVSLPFSSVLDAFIRPKTAVKIRQNGS